MDVRELYAAAQAIAPWITEKRRDLHRIPETGFQEFKTQALILRELDALGIPYKTERTWVIGDVAGAYPGPVIALRADMDALPLVEPEDRACRSEHEGWMHACGHDMHVAILLGAARLLSGLRATLRGSVRLLFQPAEETVGGAAPMVAAGAMRGVDAVYGLHVQPYLAVGQIDSRSGCLNAACDEIDIIVRGVSGHAARPETGVDAIVCAAQLLTALQTVVSRSTSPLNSAALSFGIIQGGTAANIICDEVRLRGTLRTADPVLRAHLHARIREICAGIASACGARIELDLIHGFTALMNTPDEVERVFRLGRELLGPDNVRLLPSPSMGGEDFSYFVAQVPGAFWHLGCSAELPAPPLHSRDFNPDERCLPIGAALQCALALDRMGMLD